MKSNHRALRGQTPTRTIFGAGMRSMCGIPSRRCANTLRPSRSSWSCAAEGHYLIDDRGRRLFDGTSALWCNLLGHRVPEIDAAVTEQLGRFAHTTLLGTTHPARRGAGAAAGRDRPSRPESRLLLRQRRHRGRGGAEDGVPVPAAHAGQGGRRSTRSISASRTPITATRWAPRRLAASSSSTTSSSRFSFRR